MEKHFQEMEPLHDDDALVVAIGGTVVPDFAMRLVYGHLVDAFSKDIPRQVKLVPLPGGGFGPLDDTYEAVVEKIQIAQSKAPDRPLVVVGHSQGAVHATRLALDGLADAVVSLAGPLRGVTLPIPFASQVRWALRHPAAERDLAEGSDYLNTLGERMYSSWPEDVPLTVVAATHDFIVPPRAQFGVQLSPGAAPPSGYIVMPRRMSQERREAIARSAGVPREVQHLVSALAAEHLTLPRATGLIALLGTIVEDIRQ